MVFDDGEEVDANGVEEEHFLLKVGVMVGVRGRWRERGGEGRNGGVARREFGREDEGGSGIGKYGEMEGSGARKRGEERGRRRMVDESAIGEEVKRRIRHCMVNGELCGV